MPIILMSIADFKRAMVLGRQVHTTYHMENNGYSEHTDPQKRFMTYKNRDMGVRSVSKNQSSQFALATLRKKDKDSDEMITVDSWCYWPKKDYCEFNKNTITIFEDDYRFKDNNNKPTGKVKCLTYTILDKIL